MSLNTLHCGASCKVKRTSIPALLRLLARPRAITLLATLALSMPIAHARDVSCKVVGVSDGDTLTCLTPAKKQIKVRLAEIDAPEKKQAFGQRSQESLAELCHGKQATLRAATRDRYGRTVARVNCAGTDANAAQVHRGMAWVYDRYVKDKSLYRLQSGARAERRGLWADRKPVAPWVWRRKVR